MGNHKQKIRPLAVCVFFRGEEVLLQVGYDQVKEQTFYRPLGGGIKFGERGRDAVAREIREEIGAEITPPYLIDTLENIFTYAGEPGHELVQVYTAAFADPVFNDLDVIIGQEADETPLRAVWKPLADFIDGRDILYPDGLLPLLQEWQRTLGMLAKLAHGADGADEFDWESALRELKE